MQGAIKHRDNCPVHNCLNISVIQFISNYVVKIVQFITNYIVTIVATAVRWRRASRDTLSQRSLSASDASVAIRVTLFK